ncbi:MAG: asparagine synthetase B [Gemmatimonadales bacterium]
MKRREFVARSCAGLATLSPLSRVALASSVAPWLLVPMDDAQADHLKAYGLTFRLLERGGRAEWFLNYRNGSFLLPADAATARDAALAGVTTEPLDDGRLVQIRGQLQEGNMDAVPLEKAPKVAVYAPPNAAPWDDAVTMALNYAGIKFDKIWDEEVVGETLKTYDWLHLHHEDFTGQFSKFFLSYAGAPWLVDMVERNREVARSLGFPSVPAEKKAVASAIAAYVERGGFLFAMCTATETLDLALAADGVDIAASYADGSPMDPDASSRMRWDRALAFHKAQLELSPTMPVYSDIDGHRVNSPDRRQPLGSFTLFNFSAKIDPVAAMLVQNHRQVIPDFYGLTTSFTRDTLKPSVTILAEEPGTPWVKYLHGERGQGTWTFFGGHDPEDPQHQIGDSATDLSLHPHSPGYRLILNNVLFPAAKKKELKT